MVAFFCAVFGLTFGLHHIAPLSFTSILYLHVAAYSFLTLAYFFARYMLLEEEYRENLINAATVVVLFFIICVLVVVFMAPNYLPKSSWWNSFVLILSALMPYFYLCIVMFLRLRGSPSDDEFLFKTRVLIPAFATCLTSVTFGWALAHNYPYVMAIPFILTVVGGEVVRRQFLANRWFLAVLFLTVSMIFSLICALFFSSEILSVVAVGSILTMAMGTAEVCKRAVWVNSGKPGIGRVVGREDAQYYLAGANLASTVFPLLLLLLPLLVLKFSVMWVFIVSSFQYLHWHYWFRTKSGKLLTGINVVLGFALPLVLTIQYALPSLDAYPQGQFIDVIGFTALFMAAFALTTGPWVGRFYEFRVVADNLHTYLSPTSCFCLFVLLAFFLVVLIAYLGIWLESQTYFLPKVEATIMCTLLLIFVAGIHFAFQNMVGVPKQPLQDR